MLYQLVDSPPTDQQMFSPLRMLAALHGAKHEWVDEVARIRSKRF